MFLFISCCFSVAAKTQVDPVGNFNSHVFETWKGESIRIGPFSVKGSPYLFGEAFEGAIQYNGGRTLNKTRILYDVYHQKAGVELQSMIYEAVEPVESFVIKLTSQFGGQPLQFKAASFFGAGATGFYNVLIEGKKVAFLKQYKSKLIADPSNTMDTKMKVFEQFVEYYLYKSADRSLHQIKLRKKDLMKELADDKFFTEYTNNNTVDFSKENDVANMMEAYNNN